MNRLVRRVFHDYLWAGNIYNDGPAWQYWTLRVMAMLLHVAVAFTLLGLVHSLWMRFI